MIFLHHLKLFDQRSLTYYSFAIIFNAYFSAIQFVWKKKVFLNGLKNASISTCINIGKELITSLHLHSHWWQNVGKRFPGPFLKMRAIHAINSWMWEQKNWNHVQPKQKKITALSVSVWKILSFRAMHWKVLASHTHLWELKCHVHFGREKNPQVLITTKKCSCRNQTPGDQLLKVN